MNQVRYRTEAFSGLGERDAAEVMAFETFELGNTDILEYLRDNVLKNNPISDRLLAFITELENNGYVDDMPTNEKVNFFHEVLDEIEKETGLSVKYVLWLADKEAVTNKEFYGKDMLHDEDFDCYEVGPVILSDLGYDGTLYGYTTMPVCLEDRIENLKAVLTDIINARESDHLSKQRALELDDRYLELDAEITAISEILAGKLSQNLSVSEPTATNTHECDREVALQSEGKGYIEVHETDEGFDYSIYGLDMKLIDGGIIEDKESTAYETALFLCKENCFDNPSIVSDYDEFLMGIDAANIVKPSLSEQIQSAAARVESLNLFPEPKTKGISNNR